MPLIFMVSTSLKASRQIAKFPPELIPNPFIWGNYTDVFIYAPMHQYLLNTYFSSSRPSLARQSLPRWPLTPSPACARRQKYHLHLIMLSTMMLPGVVTMIPTYIIFRQAGLGRHV